MPVASFALRRLLALLLGPFRKFSEMRTRRRMRHVWRYYNVERYWTMHAQLQLGEQLEQSERDLYQQLSREVRGGCDPVGTR